MTTPPPEDPFAAPGAGQQQPGAAEPVPPAPTPPPGYPSYPSNLPGGEGQPPGYGAYPTAPGPPPVGPAPQPPQSILTAVKLMYVGAGLSALTIVFAVLSRDAIRDAIEENDSSLSADQIDSAVTVFVVVLSLIGLIGVALWLWMAAMNKRGRSWARVVATVLGGLNIISTLLGLNQSGGLNIVLNLVTLVLAGTILWFLYRKESSDFYSAVSAQGRWG